MTYKELLSMPEMADKLKFLPKSKRNLGRERRHGDSSTKGLGMMWNIV